MRCRWRRGKCCRPGVPGGPNGRCRRRTRPAVLDLVADANGDRGLQHHGLEITRKRGFAEGAQILPCRGQELRDLLGSDADCGTQAIVRVLIADDHGLTWREAIHAGEVRIEAARREESDHRGGSVTPRDIGFSGRASIVGEFGTEEHLGVEFGGIARVRDGRVAGKDKDGLAFYVDALVVIPLVFGLQCHSQRKRWGCWRDLSPFSAA